MVPDAENSSTVTPAANDLQTQVCEACGKVNDEKGYDWTFFDYDRSKGGPGWARLFTLCEACFRIEVNKRYGKED